MYRIFIVVLENIPIQMLSGYLISWKQYVGDASLQNPLISFSKYSIVFILSQNLHQKGKRFVRRPEKCFCFHASG